MLDLTEEQFTQQFGLRVDAAQKTIANVVKGTLAKNPKWAAKTVEESVVKAINDLGVGGVWEWIQSHTATTESGSRKKTSGKKAAVGKKAVRGDAKATRLQRLLGGRDMGKIRTYLKERPGASGAEIGGTASLASAESYAAGGGNWLTKLFTSVSGGEGAEAGLRSKRWLSEKLHTGGASATQAAGKLPGRLAGFGKLAGSPAGLLALLLLPGMLKSAWRPPELYLPMAADQESPASGYVAQKAAQIREDRMIREMARNPQVREFYLARLAQSNQSAPLPAPIPRVDIGAV